MLLVTAVDGPETAEVGSVAHYEASAFNQPNPEPADLARINWEVQCDGVRVSRSMAAGPTLYVAIAPEYAGRTLLAMPFANSPTERVSAKTAISGPAQQITEPATVSISTDGQRYSAQINDGPTFFVGSDVRFQSLRGLMNTTPGTDIYTPEAYRENFGIWADLIAPTVMCESKGSFHCLNTYDRAAFTFGFMQDAVHEPDENFVLLLRRFLLLKDAQFYFPDLVLQNGHIFQKTPGGTVQLEDDTSSQGLMSYLNPDPDAVCQQEAEVAAKFVHWAENNPENRATQVAFTIEQQRQKYASYARRYNLNGAKDSVCIVVADIRHQGRAKSSVIEQALKASDPLNALLDIGSTTYASRIETLRQEIEKMTTAGILAKHVYNLEKQDFVVG
ncbi:hypothetical protein [Nisaea denitrificans]|uniref:hypothetical protein n=1 Tax=Nisaea denitrificans TaxID=390877 RepID=UPI0004294F2C|nr:hypothetical protein [Nisaea denitrificans]